jgi:hypothetical protein
MPDLRAAAEPEPSQLLRLKVLRRPVESALYALIAVIAAFPGLVTGVGVPARALQAEAILLTVLVFAGVNVAWLLLFEEPRPSVPHRAGQ